MRAEMEVESRRIDRAILVLTVNLELVEIDEVDDFYRVCDGFHGYEGKSLGTRTLTKARRKFAWLLLAARDVTALAGIHHHLGPALDGFEVR